VISDVIVVGAGVVGCAIASFLARDGHRVSVFDAGGVAAGASGRNAGLVEHPYDGAQEPLYDETVCLLADLLGAGMPKEPVGVLLLAEDEAAAHRLVAAHAAYASLRPTVLGPVDLGTVEPLLTEGTWGCLLRTGYPIDPAAATNALADRARSHGARFHLGDAVSLAWDHDVCTGVQRGSEVFRADAVVIAAGAQSSQLVDPAGGWQPIHALWGVSATLKLQPQPRHVLLEGSVASIQVGGSRTDEAAFSLIPSADSVALGSTFLVDEPCGDDWVPRMLSRGSRFCPALAAADVRHLAVCARPWSFDGRPLIGKVPQAQRLWIAAGHGGRGVSTGAASGRLLSEAITSGDEGVIPVPLRASRFPGSRTRDRI
jgi:glycine/D-amino acid oxidase-like deaminating enzyme